MSNGLPVWIVEQHELPVVQMSLVVPAGTDADPPDRYGVASLTSALLTEGAGTRSGVEIADALDGLLANLSGSSGVDSSSLQLYVPAGRLAEALPLMADVAQRPTFPEPALDAARRQRIGTLRNARGDPDAIAALAFARDIFGPSHRGAAPLAGTADSLAAMTADDLRAFHAFAYRPANSTLIVVGDVDADGVLPLVDAHFGKWFPAAVNGMVREPQPPPPRQPRRVLLVDMPGAPQSRILIGGVGAAGATSDFVPLQILDAIVRNRLSADRNATLRDSTTGVRSGFDRRKSATPFAITAAAPADQTARALETLVGEVTAIVKGIPADELTRARDETVRALPKMFEATGRISSRLQALEALVVYGLPDEASVNHASAIEAVAPADVQRVARQYLDPDHLTMVIVGDRKTIEAPIRALKLGPLTGVSIDEVFAPQR